MSPPVVSPHTRIRHRESFEIGPDSIVDDFCYFSTRVVIGRCSHIASGCSVAGGHERLFRLGDFSSLSSGVKIWCTSDDFVRDIVVALPADVPQVKRSLITGDVVLDRCTAVGANSVVMPDNHLPEGSVVGALSFVPPRFAFEPWSVYAGIPVRKVSDRDRDAVLSQAEQLERALAEREDAR